ncbi:DNA-directed RNA polymerase [Candidatus Woesearchaeota archaeon]|nr:DNA-directed RNA polymerase [Candidatus Woesearchaeota archaeon]
MFFYNNGGNKMPGFERGGFDSSPREMHKATCSECGEECEVPFKPTEGKPVFCRECYRKRRRF